MVLQTFCSTNTKTETELFQDGCQIKREKDIYHHGPKHILIICHLPDPPSFSLPTTFKLLLSCLITGCASDKQSTALSFGY
jgi:hypothetical protein